MAFKKKRKIKNKKKRQNVIQLDVDMKYPKCMNQHPLNRDCNCSLNDVCKGNTLQDDIEHKRSKKLDCYGQYFHVEPVYKKRFCKKCDKRKKCKKQSISNENFKSRNRRNKFLFEKNIFAEHCLMSIPKINSNKVQFNKKARVLNDLLKTNICFDQKNIDVYELIEDKLYYRIKNNAESKLPSAKDMLLIIYIFNEIYKNNNNIFTLYELALIHGGNTHKRNIGGKNYRSVYKLLQWACQTEFIAKQSFFLCGQNIEDTQPDKLICFSLLSDFKEYQLSSSNIIKINTNDNWANYVISVNIKNGYNGIYMPISTFSDAYVNHFVYFAKFINHYSYFLENLQRSLFPLKFIELKNLNQKKNDITLSKEERKKIVKKIDERQRWVKKKTFNLNDKLKNIYYTLDDEKFLQGKFCVKKLLQ